MRCIGQNRKITRGEWGVAAATTANASAITTVFVWHRRPSYAWLHDIISICSTLQHKLFAFVDASSDKRIVQRCGPTCGYLQQFMRIYAFFFLFLRWCRWWSISWSGKPFYENFISMHISYSTPIGYHIHTDDWNRGRWHGKSKWNCWLEIGVYLSIFVSTVERIFRWQVDNDCDVMIGSVVPRVFNHWNWYTLSFGHGQLYECVISWER